MTELSVSGRRSNLVRQRAVSSCVAGFRRWRCSFASAGVSGCNPTPCQCLSRPALFAVGRASTGAGHRAFSCLRLRRSASGRSLTSRSTPYGDTLCTQALPYSSVSSDYIYSNSEDLNVNTLQFSLMVRCSDSSKPPSFWASISTEIVTSTPNCAVNC